MIVPRYSFIDLDIYSVIKLFVVNPTRTGRRRGRLAEAEPAEETDGGRVLQKHGPQQTKQKLQQEIYT